MLCAFIFRHHEREGETSRVGELPGASAPSFKAFFCFEFWPPLVLIMYVLSSKFQGVCIWADSTQAEHSRDSPFKGLLSTQVST